MPLCGHCALLSQGTVKTIRNDGNTVDQGISTVQLTGFRTPSEWVELGIKKEMKTNISWLIVVGFVLTGAISYAQNRIEVIINEVKDTTGHIRVGLFTDQESFLKKPLVGKVGKAATGTVVIVFENVPPGTYAVSTIHDSNRNGELDSNLFGMPKEGFGFSNDAMGTFGPPSFDKAKFTVSSSLTIRVKTRYL